jgi:hypothetical protein
MGAFTREKVAYQKHGCADICGFSATLVGGRGPGFSPKALQSVGGDELV